MSLVVVPVLPHKTALRSASDVLSYGRPSHQIYFRRFFAAVSGLGYDRNLDAEIAAKTPATDRSDPHSPARLNPLDPAECKAALRQCRADNATKMRPTLAPITA